MKLVSNARPGFVVGIDLGTSNSLVAILRDREPVVLRNALGEALTPSVVSIDEDGSVLVGAAAHARHATHPERTARLFKRDMGTTRKLDFGGKRMRAEELSALVLAALKRDAEEILGGEVVEAVVTVPAYFGDAQRQATRAAGAIAGLVVERIINEPTAAALAYGLHHREEEIRAVVLDLGGGTFDVTVLEIIEGVIEIQATAGDARLGGEDFAELLAEVLAEEILTQHGEDPRAHPIAWARLRTAAEAAKRELSEHDIARVSVPRLALGRKVIDVARTFTRAEARSAWEPLLERMRGPIRRAVRDADVVFADIDEVLLVGGATRMPCVVTLATELFGRDPLATLPADEAVAIGAAIQAGLKQGLQAVDDMVVTDVAPFSMGIESSARMGRQMVEGLYAPILERGTTIPASRTQSFVTTEDGQAEIAVKVYQGEHSLCADNEFLGEYRVGRLPRKPAGEAGIEVRFTYDLNGILEVEMTILGTTRVEHLVLTGSDEALSPKKIESARRAMAALKFHPRELLPNRTLLARADALYVELRGPVRDELGAALAAFRAALETQDPETVDFVRENLARVVDAVAHTLR